ncbi:nuclear transport factor 2 family protein [Alcaligenes faecalis]|uniref:nuclear transport factor 2 family protein n=1 Tax=Alcaligenes faecalis TaxID=511 RepID=UPI000F0BD485|nr:nuclear transport factor 2 family protein [Alcaligenes faecalis]AYR20512.1 nuclear transport factor 2 family protein [Alcaligenes faecalis]
MKTDWSTGSDDSAAAVRRIVQLYQELAPDRLSELEACYAPDAYFKDPFNEVRGVPAIRGIFEHMFTALQAPRFVITQQIVQDHRAFLEWEFRFRLRRWKPEVEQCIKGASFLSFDEQGRVSHHRDYWDAAEELYAKLPLLGVLMRWLQRKVSSS